MELSAVDDDDDASSNKVRTLPAHSTQTRRGVRVRQILRYAFARLVSIWGQPTPTNLCLRPLRTYRCFLIGPRLSPLVCTSSMFGRRLERLRGSNAKAGRVDRSGPLWTGGARLRRWWCAEGDGLRGTAILFDKPPSLSHPMAPIQTDAHTVTYVCTSAHPTRAWRGEIE